MKMDSTYHVGDNVLVKGVHECTYGWNEQMEALCGNIATIRRVDWDRSSSMYSYKLNEDPGAWTWDDSCFEPAVPLDLPEFDTSGANVLDLFS